MKGIIYKIYHKDNENLFYIGSTIDFDRRKREHKSQCNNGNAVGHNIKLYQIIRENGSWECFQFDIIEELSCETIEELHKKEEEYITTLKPVMNSQKAFGDLKEYKKQYYVNNKERINEIKKQKIKCECGGEVRIDSLLRHKKSKKHINFIQRTYSRNGLPSH